MDQRCDGVTHCDEDFDEKSCSMVRADRQLYRKEVPPLGITGDVTKVHVDLQILSLGDVDELLQTFNVKVFVRLQW